MDWLSAFMGTLLIRTILGGSALLGFTYIWHGYYLLAAGVLVPLAGALALFAADLDADLPDLERD